MPANDHTTSRLAAGRSCLFREKKSEISLDVERSMQGRVIRSVLTFAKGGQRPRHLQSATNPRSMCCTYWSQWERKMSDVTAYDRESSFRANEVQCSGNTISERRISFTLPAFPAAYLANSLRRPPEMLRNCCDHLLQRRIKSIVYRLHRSWPASCSFTKTCG